MTRPNRRDFVRRARRPTLEPLERRDLPTFAAAPTFALAGDYGNGIIAVEHLNNDSHLDSVVASEFSKIVNVLLGTGNSNFATATTFDTGGVASGLALGDINGDGYKDIVTGIGSSVSVMMNDGDATFPSTFTWIIGSAARDVALGDFDNDSDMDIAVAGSTTVSILLNAGNGIFFPHTSYPAGANSYSMAVADFDHDGDLDIVVANYNAGGTVSVIMGQGDGTFASPERFRTGGKSPQKVTVGDFNGDSFADIAVSNRGSNTVGVLLNLGDGSFGSPKGYAASPNPYGITAGDFDGNGHDDLAVVSWDYYGAVHVLLSNANGTFKSPTSYSTSIWPRNLAVGDFDANGTVDLVYLTGSLIPGAMVILRGRGDGSFQIAPIYEVGNSPIRVATGDFNGDGIEDLVLGDYPTGLQVLLGNGNGTFQLPVTTYVDTSVLVLAAEDFNADGLSDVALVDGQQNLLRVFLGLGNGNFQPATSYPTGDGANAITTADFDGDDDVDLAVTNYYDETMLVFLGLGDGTFQAGANYSISANNHALAAGDFNNDGRVDLATGGGLGWPKLTVTIFLGNGDGSFTPVSPFYSGTSAAIVPGDFNQDGHIDLVTVSGQVFYMLLGNGNGSFRAPVFYESAGGVLDAVVSDFDGDGYPDLGFSHAYGVVSVVRGHASGTLQNPTYFDTSGSGAEAISQGDFNTDGRPDIVVAKGGVPGTVPGRIGLLFNDGNWPAPMPITDRAERRFTAHGWSRPEMKPSFYAEPGPVVQATSVAATDESGPVRFTRKTHAPASRTICRVIQREPLVAPVLSDHI